MTTKEIETTTEQIETEEITFCDSCGADERTAEIVTLSKNPRMDVVRQHRGTEFKRQQIDPGERKRVPIPVTHERTLAQVDHDGTIDACEACIREHFNEEVVTPLFELEPRETATQERETDVSRRREMYGFWPLYYLALWVLFPAQMFKLRLQPEGEPLHKYGEDYFISGVLALFVWTIYAVAFLAVT